MFFLIINFVIFTKKLTLADGYLIISYTLHNFLRGFGTLFWSENKNVSITDAKLGLESPFYLIWNEIDFDIT